MLLPKATQMQEVLAATYAHVGAQGLSLHGGQLI